MKSPAKPKPLYFYEIQRYSPQYGWEFIAEYVDSVSAHADLFEYQLGDPERNARYRVRRCRETHPEAQSAEISPTR